MFVTMAIAGLVVGAAFGAFGVIPAGPRPTRANVFGAIHADYKLVLNVLATLAFVALWALTARRGTIDPVCGMSVDRERAVRREVGGTTVYFCSEHCAAAYRPVQNRPTFTCP
jgi:YHS domain-containing protein